MCAGSAEILYGGPDQALIGRFFFSVWQCACDDEVKVVEVANASVRSTLEGDSERICALALTADDKFLFTASHSEQLKLWDLSSATCLRSWKVHNGPVLDMTCDASGGLLATAGADRNILVWDVDGGFCTHSFRGHQGVVTTVKFHPDPHRLLLFSGSIDATVRVWFTFIKASTYKFRGFFTIPKHRILNLAPEWW